MVTVITVTDATSGEKLLTFPEHLSSFLLFSGAHIAQSLVFCVVFCQLSCFFCVFFYLYIHYCLSFFNLRLLMCFFFGDVHLKSNMTTTTGHILYRILWKIHLKNIHSRSNCIIKQSMAWTYL